MKLSQNFTKTFQDAPKDEVSKNAQLLIRAGYIHKEMAGVYAYLPLGLKVFENIKAIIREEMNALGAQELQMTTLQQASNWTQTDRWTDDKVDIWFKTALKNGTELGLAWSHEEPITLMMKQHVASYKDLPAIVYQFQNKMRNETRAKSGIMRTREFVMKDMYSYSVNEANHQAFYDKSIDAYHRIFDRVGIGHLTYFTTASGGAFTQFSHEFQTICDAGEDVIYIDEQKKTAINKEVFTDEVIEQLGFSKGTVVEKKSAEVGNIFSFGGTKSEQLGLTFVDQDGSTKPVILGSYGIGVGRLMGVVAEVFSDENGIIWPESIAPYQIHLITIGGSDSAQQACQELYDDLRTKGVSVLWDDRDDVRPGKKFADADLIGMPHRVVVSKKTLEVDMDEYKKRTDKESKNISKDELLNIEG